ncbi:MAG: hypothetical protein M3N38_04210 [Pseudomonadota bacterium]|nr:hypothetical protein [Pseudomonadota bacterium]
MLRHDGLITSVLFATALTVGVSSYALLASESVKPAIVEAIPGSDLKRVILTVEAAQRIAIETTTVREEPVKRWLLVDGEVEAVPNEPAAPAAADGVATPSIVPVRVRVPRLDDPDDVLRRTFVIISLGDDDDDDDDDEPEADDDDDDDTNDGNKILVLTIDGSNDTAARAAPLDEAFAGTEQYFHVSNTDHRLTPGRRVQLKLAQPDSGKPHRVVPYSAVIYDLHGGTWVYGNPEPQVFVRQPIAIEYIHRDLAVLKDGPPTGTVIVSIGAAELMGVEQRLVK